MKKYCICTVCSMVLGVLALFVFLYCMVHHFYDEAVVSALFVIGAVGAAFFSYYSAKIIQRVWEKYSSFNDPRKAEDYLMTLGDAALELFFSSFSSMELKVKKSSYEHRLAFVDYDNYKSFIEKDCEARTCRRLLRFITKNIKI